MFPTCGINLFLSPLPKRGRKGFQAVQPGQDARATDMGGWEGSLRGGPGDRVRSGLPSIFFSLQHIMLRQAKVPVAADDQVVVDRKVQGPAGLDYGLSQFLIRSRGAGIAARVIVDQNEPRGLVFQGQLQNLSRIHHRLIHRAFLEDLFGNDFVLAVEVEHPKLLVFQAPHGGAAVVHQHVQRRDALALQGLFLEIDPMAGLYQMDEAGRILLEPHEIHQGLGGGVQDLPEGAEVGDETLGQRFDIRVRNGKSQQQLQKLIVLQRGRTALQEPGPEAGAVPVVMRLAASGFALGAHLGQIMRNFCLLFYASGIFCQFTPAKPDKKGRETDSLPAEDEVLLVRYRRLSSCLG